MTSDFDAHLDAVLMGGREKRPIVIVEHSPQWVGQFTELARQIRGAVGENALMAEHIGSTSVPGLAAKAIIDILLTVKDVADERSYLPQLEDAGFVLRVREPGHRMFRTGERDVHLHVFSNDDETAQPYLELRDWLRQHDEDRLLYEETKKALGQQQWTDMNYYADAKTAVITAILGRARRVSTQRRQGPSR